MKSTLFLLAFLFVAVTLASCGQRVTPPVPAGKVHDSDSY